MEAIQKVSITKKVRMEVINVIAFSILSHTERPTSEEYTTVCRMLISKYPVLRDAIGNGYVFGNSVRIYLMV